MDTKGIFEERGSGGTGKAQDIIGTEFLRHKIIRQAPFGLGMLVHAMGATHENVGTRCFVDIGKIAKQFDEPIVVDISMKHFRMLGLAIRARQRPPRRHQRDSRLRTERCRNDCEHIGMICYVAKRGERPRPSRPNNSRHGSLARTFRRRFPTMMLPMANSDGSR